MKMLAALFRMLAGFTLVIMFAASSVTQANAHSDLESSDPTAGQMLEQMPAKVTLTFAENIMVVVGSENANQVVVSDTSSNRLDSGMVEVIRDQVIATIEQANAQGTITVSYRVVSADGHPVEGSFQFAVGSASVIAPVPAEKVTEPEPIGDWTPTYLIVVGFASLIAVAFIYRRRN
jgi:methionine-rich copper-binding protein CopC